MILKVIFSKIVQGLKGRKLTHFGIGAFRMSKRDHVVHT